METYIVAHEGVFFASKFFLWGARGAAEAVELCHSLERPPAAKGGYRGRPTVPWATERHRSIAEGFARHERNPQVAFAL